MCCEQTSILLSSNALCVMKVNEIRESSSLRSCCGKCRSCVVVPSRLVNDAQSLVVFLAAQINRTFEHLSESFVNMRHPCLSFRNNSLPTTRFVNVVYVPRG